MQPYQGNIPTNQFPIYTTSPMTAPTLFPAYNDAPPKYEEYLSQVQNQQSQL